MTGDVFPAFDLGREPLFPFLADFALVTLFDGGVFECAAFGLCDGVGVEEGLPGFVATVFHAENLGGLEGVHGDGADEGNVDA